MIYLENNDRLIRRGISYLLEIKDSDIRLMNLYQCQHAVDSSIHIGGAFSSVIPMVSLFYGGIIDVDVENPTATDQDQFVLSKGHAVATLASVYSDLGYFDKSILKNSRSISSILNGHPGPLLPGVHLATGPMGQGLGVAQGFAIAGQTSPRFDVYAITGDGELQEGPIWESVMYAGYKRLENLCVLVDHNGGQLDIVNTLHFPYHKLGGSFESFGWRVIEVDATQYHSVYDTLLAFKYGKRDGRPTAIICKSTKGHGGFSSFMNNHKTTIKDSLLEQEVKLQQAQRANREKDFFSFLAEIQKDKQLSDISNIILSHLDKMGFKVVTNDAGEKSIANTDPDIAVRKAPKRDKKIAYNEKYLPDLVKGKPYGAHTVIAETMKVLAQDKRIFSVDSDLASTSGLQDGVGYVDKNRALNVGVAEANMMLIGEAFSILGSNVWISTFCPFYDWKVLRRIAVGHQERLEVIADNGWLSEGHGIDLTMVATAADLETQSNGATHMGNDDALLLNEAAHVKIINVSCPQQLLSIIKWIAEGNKGIIYLRVLRAPAAAIYDSGFKFEYGKSYALKNHKDPHAYIVSTGRGVYEALNASENLSENGMHIEVIDMPSIDEKAILDLYRSRKPVFIAEQNNGYLWTNFRKVLFSKTSEIDTRLLFPINLSSEDGLHYVHSGTYAELADRYGLNADNLTKRILDILK